MSAAKHGGDDATSSMPDIPSDVASLPAPAEHKLLIPDSDSGAAAGEGSPLVICFHGSGESCSPSWDKLAAILSSAPINLRVLLYNRGDLNPKPARATAELRAYLRREGLRGPYVLIAHSYGGSFARMFLERERKGESAEDEGGEGSGEGQSDEGAYAPRQVVGVVLVETGQEGGLDPKVEERQYKRRVLGSRPLSVIKGNSFLRMWDDLERAEKSLAEGDEFKRGELMKRRVMLGVWEDADEDMKRKQLDLAKEGGAKRLVNVPDCGHNVQRDRPEAVAKEVAWVVENMRLGDEEEEAEIEEEEKTERESSRSEKGKQKGWMRIGREFWKVYEMIIGRFFDKFQK
ncbi:Alpha/beta hydrolase family-domain-containing protein [Annulohypoxylon truncatum]|uniref:Alpha/beta hydrolase family-domain-containing protein n=1 Tax=Annulohypoxylon truncatum TaxID=327061 RepID=UPI0020080677|nr:Alpha/beta hydrolase family-domain-containing protein [Annulohypoxylon truncatum]KAI1209238.1 Alpha/beta hydrolase family-domain-containing protein [Annulohypoxylon truncatum]